MSKRYDKGRQSTNLDATNDQFTDFDSVDDLLGFKSRIIFSDAAKRTLERLIVESQIGIGGRPGSERGCCFYGRELGKNSNQIYIDAFSSDFLPANGFFEGGSVNHDYVLSNEVDRALNNYDCLFHFHTHSKNGFYDVFSDIDLEIYEALSTDAVILRHNASVFGLLATPNREDGMHHNIQLSCVFCSPSKKQDGTYEYDFYRFPNMCYVEGDLVYEIGQYQRTIAPRLSNGRNVRTDVMIPALGFDPNTGAAIESKPVGIFQDGKFYFGTDIIDAGIVSSETFDGMHR